MLIERRFLLKIQLICLDEKRDDLITKLVTKGFTLSDDARYIFYDKEILSSKFITAKSSDNIHLIEYTNILYFESYNNTTYCITDDDKYVIKEKLYKLEKFLALNDFIRVNKSMLVNILSIEKIIPWVGSKFVLLMKNNCKIDVNRTYYDNFKKRIGL